MKAVSLLLLFLPSAISWAQTHIDTTYQVELTATASPMISDYRNPSVPGTDHKTSFGYGIFVRGMWHPGRLLSVGFMTGYSLIDQDEIPIDRSLVGQPTTENLNYSARLTAIPMQLAISMQKHDFEIGIGIGPYMMLSTIEGGNTAPAGGRRLELGLTFFGSYVFSLNDNIKIGPELRVLYLRYRGILTLMPSCSFRIDAVRY
jgi:hypothetical protein